MSDSYTPKTLVDKAIEALESNDVTKYQAAKDYLRLAAAQLEKSSPIKAFASNPMVLLVIGAIVTGLLVPYITLQWQTNEHELELETALASEMSESAGKFITTIGNVQLKLSGYPINISNSDYDQAYNDWLVSKWVIASKLMSYYPHTPQLLRDWKLFGDLVEAQYALTGIYCVTENNARQNVIQDINSTHFFARDPFSVDWKLLGSCDSYDRKNRGEWVKLQTRTMEIMNGIIEQAVKVRAG